MTHPDLRAWTRSFGNLAAGEVVTSALRLLALLLVARRLGPAAFGVVSVGFIVGGYLVILAHPGLEVAATRRIAREPSAGAQLLARVVGLRLVLGAVAYPLTVVTAAALPLSDDMSTVIVLFGLLIFTQGLDVRWAFVGLQRTAPVAIASVVGAATYLLAIIALVHDRSDIVLVAVVHVGAQSVIAAVLLVVSRRTFGRWFPQLRRGAGQLSIFVESTPLTMASVARAATVTVDVILVKLFRPAHEAGEYAAASRLMSVGLVYLSLYYSTLFPSLVRAARRGNDELRVLARAGARRAIVAGAVVALGCVGLIPIVVPVVFGDEYEATVGLLQVLTVALFLVGLSGVVNNSLVALGRERTFARIMGMGLAVNLLANFVLLPTVGTVGAAIATVVTEAVALVVGFIALRSMIGRGTPRVVAVSR